MSNKNDHDTYIIPPNFIETGTFFGGMFRARNVIEAGILVFAIGAPVFLFLPFGLTTRIIILCLTALPVGLVALIGISGESLSQFLVTFLKYLRNRRVVGGDGEQPEDKAAPSKSAGKHLKQRPPKEKKPKAPKRRRSGEADFPAEFDEVRSYEIREKLRPKKNAKKERPAKANKAKKKAKKRPEKGRLPKRPAHIKEQKPTCLNPVADYSLFKQASDTVRSGVIIGLGSRLQVFQSELIKKITTRDEIDLELPGQERCAYFLVTSDQDSTFDFLASLFLSFCFIKLVRYADKNCEGGKLPVPVHILGEELTACGTIPDLSRRLSVIRSRNISMSCVFQNLAGLQNRYPLNLWQEILGNCDAQLFLGCTDSLTAEFISERTGLASVSVSSKSKQLGTWRISNYTPEYRETSGVGKRPVLTPDEVLRLPITQALVIIRGQKALKVEKMDYSKHPESSKLRDCKASAHIPEWRELEEQAQPKPAAAPPPAPKPKESAPKKPAAKRKPKSSGTPAAPKSPPSPPASEAPDGIITTDKDSILS